MSTSVPLTVAWLGSKITALRCTLPVLEERDFEHENEISYRSPYPLRVQHNCIGAECHHPVRNVGFAARRTWTTCQRTAIDAGTTPDAVPGISSPAPRCCQSESCFGCWT